MANNQNSPPDSQHNPTIQFEIFMILSEIMLTNLTI